MGALTRRGAPETEPFMRYWFGAFVLFCKVEGRGFFWLVLMDVYALIQMGGYMLRIK